MLNFRNTTYAMILLALAVLILLLSGIRPGWYPLIFLAIWLILLVLGSVKICMNFYIKAFCKGKTDEKIISLTFDDGPDPDITPRILEILKKHDIKAAFFPVGMRAEKFPDLVKRIEDEGHVLGVHSFSHDFFFDLFSRKKMERDLLLAGKSVTVEGWKGGRVEKGMLFRPPYGVTNPTVSYVAGKLGYRVIGWSVRSLDTTLKDPRKVAERMNRRLHPGAVVLMHDTRKDLPSILEDVIKNASGNGYRMVGLEEMMEKK